MLTRWLSGFTDPGSSVVSELRRVGVDASLRQVETAQSHPLQTRGEFQIGTDRNGIECDDRRTVSDVQEGRAQYRTKTTDGPAQRFQIWARASRVFKVGAAACAEPCAERAA